MSDRTYDIIFLGASGFTGKLVMEYMATQADQDVKWAIAGRNIEKLKNVMHEMINIEVPILKADNNNEEDMVSLAKQAKVICTTVGPYAKFGSHLVQACVNHNTHYCDLAGEVQWMRKMIDQHHETAIANQTKIVHTCGFDSIPSDMGVYFLQREAKKIHGSYCKHIKARVKAMKGGMSGGTYASLNMVKEQALEDPSIYKVLNNPYGLNPTGETSGPDKKDISSVIYDNDVKSWIAPFIMAAINTKVVRRSNALSGYPYGKDFLYDESMMTGSGIAGRMKGYALLSGLGLMMSAKQGSFVKKQLDKRLPKPGEGPSKLERENGFFNFKMVGKLANGKRIVAKVTGDKDPGYGSTSKMLAETAICLAKDTELPNTYGVLTPSVAMGDLLLDRLSQNAGLGFEILD